MAAGSEQFFDNSHRIADLDRVVNILFRHADTTLAKCLEHVRFRHTLQTLKGHVANNWQLFDFEDDVDAATWTVLSQHAGCRLVEERQRQQSLVITLDLLNVVNITGPGLNVIKNVIFTQTPIADDIDAFDESLRLSLLGVSRRYEGCSDSSQ